MPQIKDLPRLECLCLTQFSQVCASLCHKLEGASVREKKSESRLVSWIRHLPGPVLEMVLPQVLKVIALAVRKNRSHKGLIKALECLPQPTLRRMDIGALFSEVRLYGEMNRQCKALLKASLLKLPGLTHLNLESKCNDEMLMELARHCRGLEELLIPMSDVSDRGLMALCGMSINGSVGPGDSCLGIRSLDIRNCMNIAPTGVSCVLRNLPKLALLNYGATLDAVETVVKIDGDYLLGKKKFLITHLDQFNDFYEFDSHPDILSIIIKTCPRLESLRFYISDEGCKSLSLINGIKHLQLEMSDIGNGFRLLTRQYGNLVSLNLTFRSMPFSQLIDIADNCPKLAMLRLMGFEIRESHNLVSHRGVFTELKVIDLRLMRNEDFDVADEDFDNMNSISPQVLHFLLDYTSNLEELTIQGVTNFMGSNFLTSIMCKNPMVNLKKLTLSVSPANNLTATLAKRLIGTLPSLNYIGPASRWCIDSKDMKELIAYIKKNNWDVSFL